MMLLAILGLLTIGSPNAQACTDQACCNGIGKGKQELIRGAHPEADTHVTCTYVAPDLKYPDGSPLPEKSQVQGNACICQIYNAAYPKAPGKNPWNECGGADGTAHPWLGSCRAKEPLSGEERCGHVGKFWNSLSRQCDACPMGKSKHCGKCVCPLGFVDNGRDASCSCPGAGLKAAWPSIKKPQGPADIVALCIDKGLSEKSVEVQLQGILTLSERKDNPCGTDASCGDPKCDGASAANTPESAKRFWSDISSAAADEAAKLGGEAGSAKSP